MRGAGVLLAAVALVGSCTADAAETTTTVTAPVDLSTTTPPDTTTTTPDPTPADICSVGLIWEPGTRYVAQCFLFPVSFLPDEPGWRSSGAAEEWVALRWVGGDAQLEVGVALLALRHDLDPVGIVDEIAPLEGIELVADPRPITLAGRTGLVVEIEASPSDGPPDARSCLPAGVAQFLEEAGGKGLIEGVSRSLLGVGYCHVVRLWLLDISGRTVTIVAGTSDPTRQGETAAIVERLLDTTSFLGNG